ncbi:MAG TPA: type VI secretion system tip protein VgrG [Hyalangium sp.]|nr:type VI secretion system tip protein VgrG [Hyalangium sp.]
MVARTNTVEMGEQALFKFDIGGLGESLRVARFSATEGLSRLFELELEIACENPDIDFSEAVGQEAMLSIWGELYPRFFHGIVSRFEQLQDLPRYTLYRVTVVPRVWRLTRRQDCRIFQQMDTPSILEEVLLTEGISQEHVRFELTGTYEPRDYCVQYRESDWDFASRLMEEDGLFFYFEHEQGSHTLVVSDDSSTLKPVDGGVVIPFRRHTGAVEREDHIRRFHFTQEVRPGRTTLRDFNFKQPGMAMEAGAKAEEDSTLEQYDFPGEYQDPRQGSAARGKTIARLRLEAWQATRRVGYGESDCERLVPGRTFTLFDHPRGDYNGSYLLTQVKHEGSQPQALDEESPGGDLKYSLTFSCIPAEVPFRSARVTPRPHMRGVQTAVVVGPAGEEIHVDKWGRVKVQFHWDRQGKRDEQSSCWIRVSQLWAGAGWGAMFIPRIGQEVIVDFIEGDPDRPIITGRVYNGSNPVPYDLPGEKTKSTIQSNSSPGAGATTSCASRMRRGPSRSTCRRRRTSTSW